MRSGLVAPRGVSSSGLLAHVLGSPALLQAVQALPSASLHRLVEQIGLEDAAELVGLASPAQLAGVFDEALWRGDRAGEDPRFDGERLGLWLEVLLEAGEGFAARTLADVSPDLVVLALCRRAIVIDLVRLTEGRSRVRSRTDDEDDGLEHALDARPSQEIAGHLVVARAEQGFDALVGVLLALDEHDHAACLRLLERAEAISSAWTEEHGGLVEALSAADTLEADVAGERADRRAAAGHVAPTDAAAFFRLARRAALPPLRAGAPPERDPITRAYFRELAPTTSATATQGSPLLAAEARLYELVEGKRTSRPQADALQQALVLLRRRDPVAHDARRGELAYVVNLVLSGCPIGADGDPPRPADAVRIASAVTLLGARCRAAETLTRGRQVDKMLVDVFAREPAERLFRIGLHRLHHGVALRVVEALASLAQQRLDGDPSVRGVLALIRKAREEGEPWILQRVLPRLGIARETPAGALLEGLLGPLPLLARGSMKRNLLPPGQLLSDGRGVLASPAEIAGALTLARAVLA